MIDFKISSNIIAYVEAYATIQLNHALQLQTMSKRLLRKLDIFCTPLHNLTGCFATFKNNTRPILIFTELDYVEDLLTHAKLMCKQGSQLKKQ